VTQDLIAVDTPAPEHINLASLDYWASATLESDFALLRADHPVTWHEHPDSGRGFWSVVRHQDIAEIANDPATFSNRDGARINHDPEMNVVRPATGTLLELDPPQHTRYRKLFSKKFTPRAVARFEDAIRARVVSLIDGVADKGRCEFVHDVAAPLPLHVICDIVGVPDDETRAWIFEMADRTVAENDPEIGGGAEGGSEAALALKEYGERLAAERATDLKDDLLSALLAMQGQEGGDALADRQIKDLFALLVAAGNETTRNSVSHGLRAFTLFPEAREQLLTRPELRWTMADEVVRWATPVLHMRRTITRDVVFRGVEMKAGQKLALWNFSGNRDDRAIDDPERFDITRDPNRLQSFGGGGPHFCLGTNLARLEIVVLFEELFKALPDIRVVGEPTSVRSNLIRGIREMQVEFSPRG